MYYEQYHISLISFRLSHDRLTNEPTNQRSGEGQEGYKLPVVHLKSYTTKNRRFIVRNNKTAAFSVLPHN